MDRLRTLSVFKAVAESGNFTKAADALEMSRPLVTRAVMDLEQALGVRLLQRSTRRISVTPVGQEVLDRAGDLLASYADLKLVSQRRASEPVGVVRLSAPAPVGLHLLADALSHYLALYPKVCVELRLHEGDWGPPVDDFDIAFCAGGNVKGTMVARHFGSFATSAYAAPDYIARRGSPMHPAELASHACLTLHANARWRFSGRLAHEDCVPSIERRLQCANVDALAALACGGAGVAVLPDFAVAAELPRGRLVRLLEDWQAEPLSIDLVYAPRRNQPMSVRTLIDHLLVSSDASAARAVQGKRLAIAGVAPLGREPARALECAVSSGA